MAATTSIRAVAIETSSRVGSVAIGTREGLVASARIQSDQRHGAELLPALAALCDQVGWEPSSLSECYVSTGPGSFTGLRIGIAVARTLAWSAGLRLVAVPTVQVIAANALGLAPPPVNLAVVLDAKRGRVYGAILRLAGDSYEVSAGPYQVEPGRLLADAPRPLAVTGEGVAYHRPAIEGAGVSVLPAVLWTPTAEGVFQLGTRLADGGRFTQPVRLLPNYVRLPEPLEKWQAAHPAGGGPSEGPASD